MSSEINFFGLTTFRNQRRKFGIKTDDRRRHMYIIGKTGMGKTLMLRNMVIQDIQQGKGIGFVDPHGEAAEELLDYIPSNRINDVIYFNPADLDFPLAFNIIEKVDLEHRHLVASGLMGVFKKIWPDVWSARMEYILNNSILALLEYPGSTLLGVNRMLSDSEYRKKVVDHVVDPVVKSFWTNEFARYTQRLEVEATAAIQNKVGQFISNPLIRNIIGQVKSSIDMRKIMDEKKILIMNISKGRVGEDNSRLLGALLITKLQLAAMSRVDIPEEKREDFFLYVDEFQNFATESFATILSEARKYRLSLTLGHQYINQMEEEVRDAVFGNVGTIVVFRVGAEDAEYLEKEFAPEFIAQDLVNLPKYNIDLKLMIDGVAGPAFSAETLPPLPKPEESSREKLINASRERYGTPRKTVEEKISKWMGTRAVPEIAAEKSQQVLYDAQCALCKKWTKVVFPPDATRPVYCKSCLKKVKEGKSSSSFHPREDSDAKNERESSPGMSLDQAFRREPVTFSGRKDTEKPREWKERARKEVNLEELKKTLEESLEKMNPEEDKEDKADEGFKKL
jgi:CxxC-x17-CxxC domain-containing protein